MEVAKHLLLHSPPPCSTRTNSKNTLSPSSSACHFPASVLVQEQRDENKPLVHFLKEDKISSGTLDRRLMGPTSSAYSIDSDEDMKDFQLHMLQWPSLWYSVPTLESEGPQTLSISNPTVEIEPHSAIALAKKALLASKEAVSLSENAKLFKSNGSSLVEEERTVRSNRSLERRLKRRGPTKVKIAFEETKVVEKTDNSRKIKEAVDQNDPLRLFLSCVETKLVTAKEEYELIEKIQEVMKLEEVKSRFQSQFAREPTLLEWAEAVGTTCQGLQSVIHNGKRSRDKLIYANFRMVVHISKQYQGRGLSLPDLLQEGSLGLMKSVEKFKPQAGCRFGTYAYWWIRQSVRKAIFQHSRTIRLPDNVYGLLSKVKEAKRVCIQQGHHRPTKEQIAASAGITVEKLDKLLFTARMPLSMQQPIWNDQNTTFQEVTADNSIEVPDISVGKDIMRKHVRGLLNILSPKERKIMQLRFGIKDGKPKSLSEIGAVFGLSKERVRQLESRALYKLKQRLSSHGLGAYTDMII